MSAEIPLTKNQKAKVDVELHEVLSKFNWYSNGPPGNCYAFNDMRKGKNAEHPLGKRQVSMHQMVLWLNGFEFEGKNIDHKDGDKLNNTFQNLRLCSQAENSYNVPKKHHNSSSNFKGVHLVMRDLVAENPNPWCIQIKLNYKSKYIGNIYDEVLGAKLYDAVCRHYFGEFASCNFNEIFIQPMSLENAREYVKQLKIIKQNGA